jgi:mannose-6-phosphate isomerase-like protein (cupin superfamily)
MMKFACLLCVLVLALIAPAQEASAPSGFQHWTAASLNQTGQTLDSNAATDPHKFAVQQLADLPNEAVLLVHRLADGQPEWHETQVDVFWVQSGSAILLVGGTLINGETVAPHEKRNGLIQGGIREKLGPGDVVRIPPRTPHQLLLDGSKEFSYIVVKVKGY